MQHSRNCSAYGTCTHALSLGRPSLLLVTPRQEAASTVGALRARRARLPRHFYTSPPHHSNTPKAVPAVTSCWGSVSRSRQEALVPQTAPGQSSQVARWVCGAARPGTEKRQEHAGGFFSPHT
ncbi:hypothetical protein E2C01_005684 [Portunus trituberculatus]|uniref:Uncharacterized protein n=1 Tax=Portunus trituberculatus TaxID=210409 RepID=A0A5B7CX96_PORTR|nr:hypothetical protein [Portunus trituberculatus]